MQIPQRYLSLAAVAVGIGLVDYWLWSSAFASLAERGREIDTKSAPARKQSGEAELLAEAKKMAYKKQRADWLAKRSVGSEVELETRLTTAGDRIEQTRRQTEEARAALRVETPETTIATELTRRLNDLARAQNIATLDRRFGEPKIEADRDTGGLKIGVDFLFRAEPAAVTDLLSGRLDNVMPFLAVESLSLRPVSDSVSDPLRKKLELSGRLSGYFLPTAPKPTTATPTTATGKTAGTKTPLGKPASSKTGPPQPTPAKPADGKTPSRG